MACINPQLRFETYINEFSFASSSTDQNFRSRSSSWYYRRIAVCLSRNSRLENESVLWSAILENDAAHEYWVHKKDWKGMHIDKSTKVTVLTTWLMLVIFFRSLPLIFEDLLADWKVTLRNYCRVVVSLSQKEFCRRTIGNRIFYIEFLFWNNLLNTYVCISTQLNWRWNTEKRFIAIQLQKFCIVFIFSAQSNWARWIIILMTIFGYSYDIWPDCKGWKKVYKKNVMNRTCSNQK